MEKLDLIRKETRPEDQRGVAIFLTETGWEKAKRIRQVIYGIDEVQATLLGLHFAKTRLLDDGGYRFLGGTDLMLP